MIGFNPVHSKQASLEIATHHECKNDHTRDLFNDHSSLIVLLPSLSVLQAQQLIVQHVARIVDDL